MGGRAIFGSLVERGKRGVSLTRRDWKCARECQLVGIQGWVQGFKRGSDVTRMFEGANLARTRSRLVLLACTRAFLGCIITGRYGAAYGDCREEKNAPGAFKRFFITTLMNQCNWFRVHARKLSRGCETCFDVPRFYLEGVKGQFSSRLSLKRTHPVITTTSPHDSSEWNNFERRKQFRLREFATRER